VIALARPDAGPPPRRGPRPGTLMRVDFPGCLWHGDPARVLGHRDPAQPGLIFVRVTHRGHAYLWGARPDQLRPAGG
jgi:hypothetical protein